MPPRPPAGKGTGRASRKRSCAAPAGTCSSRTLDAGLAASRAAPQKLQLPAALTLQGGIGSFRITLCCRSESDWLIPAVAHGDVGWPVAKGSSFACRVRETGSVSAVREAGTSARMAQSQWWDSFYKSSSLGLSRSFGIECGYSLFSFFAAMLQGHGSPGPRGRLRGSPKPAGGPGPLSPRCCSRFLLRPLTPFGRGIPKLQVYVFLQVRLGRACPPLCGFEPVMNCFYF